MSAKRSVPRKPQFPPKVADALKDASADAMLDPLVAQLLGRAVALARGRVTQAIDRGDASSPALIRSVMLNLSEPLVAYARAQNFPVALMLGPWLPEFWAALLFSYFAEDAGVSADETGSWREAMFPWNIERLTPANPIVRLDRGQDRWEGFGSSTKAARFLVDRYMNWERGVTLGRPRKAPGSPKARYTSRVPTEEIEEVAKSLASGDNWEVAAHKAGYCRRRGAETRDGCDCTTTAAYAWVNFRRKLAGGSSGRPRQEK